MEEEAENLNLKYIPKMFSDFIGVRVPVNLVMQMIIKDEITPLLIQGPSGTGKSALAMLTIKSLSCLNRPKNSAEPCGKCPHCLYFQQVGGYQPPGYLHINCPRVLDFSTYNKLFELFVYPPPLNSRYWIVLLQEFQRTAPQVRDMFLDELEQRWRKVLFLFTVMDVKADKIDAAFRQRCTLIQTYPPEREEILPWLQKICSQEDIKVADNEIFELVADYASNVPRECLMILNKLKFTNEALTVALVREILQI